MPRLAKDQKTTRLNLAVNEEVKKSLETLRDDIGADSLTEVFRRALALYEYVQKKKTDGWELYLKKGDEQGPVGVF